MNAILISYAFRQKAYKLWDDPLQKAVIPRDVIFYEEMISSKYGAFENNAVDFFVKKSLQRCEKSILKHR